jgi:hypothetical protein
VSIPSFLFPPLLFFGRSAAIACRRTHFQDGRWQGSIWLTHTPPSPVRQQVALTQPLYERRALTTSQIPNFWPLVLEQAPPDIDQYIQPSDSALLLSSLTALSVEHFEIGAGGDPRSVLIRFAFAPNEYFGDAVLEKHFWYRRAHDGWAGLVSEPVAIDWKKDRDLTGGLLDMVCRAWEREQREDGEGREVGLSDEQKALKKKIDNTGMGGLSFFAWFGFIGRRVSAEESADVTKMERERREKKLPLEPAAVEDDEAEDDVGMSLEIFPDGDDLAVAITEDLWPGAIKYFSAYLLLLPLLASVLTPPQHKRKNKTRSPTPTSNPTMTTRMRKPGRQG